MEKRISIGCIGPSDSLDVIQEVADRYFPGISLITYVEEEISMAFRPLDRCQKETSGILFSGIGVQASAMARGHVHRPYEHIPRGGYSLLRTLWEMLSQDKSVSRISIDVVEDDIIKDTIREMGVKFDKIHSMPFALALKEKAYLDRHKDLYRHGKADALISGFGAVYDALKQEGLPAFRLYPSRIQIRERLDRLLDRITARSLKSAGIAVQIIRLRGVQQDTGHEYTTMKLQGRFYLELLDYARSLQGSLFHMGNEFIIYSTRGAISTRIHQAHFQTLLKWGEKRRIIIASGIGLGTTAFEAEKAARKGLAAAVGKRQSCVFMVNREQIQGPLGTEKELSYSMQASTPEDIDTAEEIGIAPGYLAKIKALMAKTGKDTFDSHDLAACLDISPRSARRILKKFTDAGFGRITAKETAGSAGRPKNLIRLEI